MVVAKAHLVEAGVAVQEVAVEEEVQIFDVARCAPCWCEEGCVAEGVVADAPDDSTGAVGVGDDVHVVVEGVEHLVGALGEALA